MLSIVVLAGGESRRMGQNKALMPFLNQPLIERVVKRLAPYADELLVITNKPEQYQFLGVTLTPDIMPGRGALGGLYTALSSAHQPLAAVVACDMPFVSPRLLLGLRDELIERNWDAVVPDSQEGMEPFHAVYRRETCLPPLEAALKADKWRVDAWFNEVRLKHYTSEEIAVYDPQQLAFINVNTPDEWKDAEVLAEREENPEG
jgi:molybdopterin-guanine dinucleotide biosynthesis protein A